MANTAGVPYSAKKQFLEGVIASGDSFYAALYTSGGTLSPSSTTVYTSSGEVVGAGYTAGGQLLTGITFGVSGGVAYMTFSNPSWSASTLTGVVAMLIYDSSQSNAAVAILTFASTSTVSGTFTVQLPAAGASSTITLA